MFARLASSVATSDEMIMTGIWTRTTSVAEIGAVRPGEPSLAISAAAAPLSAALPAFWEKVHPPRLIRATASRGNRAKSEGSQPLDPDVRSTGMTWAVRFPPPEYRIVTKSGPRS